MSKEKVFLNIVTLSESFNEETKLNHDVKVFNTAALMAHAQQLAVISGHLGRIAACLEKLTGKVGDMPDAS